MNLTFKIPLTFREREVCRLIALENVSNADIAEKLSISHSTVKRHVEHAMAKFAVNTRAQLAAAWMRHEIMNQLANGAPICFESIGA
jgi:DNA-binding CsgD family transcriptional regulator